MHAALREVLGPSALQSGSYNRPGYLRLDFGWTTGLSPEQVRDIEQVSNEALRADLPVGLAVHDPVRGRGLGRDRALRRDLRRHQVRVVEIGGPWSRELCGGTHVDHSSQIGTVVVTGESSVGSGNRRIEAFTGVEGFAYLARERDVVAQLTGLLKTQPDDLVGRVGDLVERLRAAEKEIEKVRVGQLLAAGGDARGRRDEDRPGQRGRAPRRRRGRRRRTHARARRPRPAAAGRARASSSSSAPPTARSSVVAAINDEARARGLSANDLVRAVGPLVGGKGGGKDDVAQGGGTDASRIDEALAVVAAEVGRVAAG